MKKILSLLLSVILLVVMLMGTPVFAHSAVGSTTLAFSVNPATLSGDATPDVTITTATTSADHPDQVDAGEVMIEMATDGFGIPVPAGSVVTWVTINAPGQSPVAGSTTLAADLDALGFVSGTTGGFRAHYVTGGGSHKVNNHFSVAFDLTAIAVPSGLTIAADLASGDGSPPPGSSGPWTFRITLKNFTGINLTNVKVQGGANGWAPMTGYTATAGSVVVKGTNKTQVLTWTLNIANGAIQTLSVTVKGKIPVTAQDGEIRFLSGAWSAVYDHDGNTATPTVKSGYSGRVSLTVVVPPPDTIPPEQVSGLAVTTISTSRLNLNWNASLETDLKNYRVYRSSVSGGPYTLIASPSANSYANTGLVGGTTYYYAVSAVDISGNEGLKSTEVSGATLSNRLHISNITMSLQTKLGKTYAKATVTVVDAAGKPASSATVSGHWSGAVSNTSSGKTGSTGQVTLQSTGVVKPPQGTVFTFTVDNISKNGWNYDETSNILTSNSISTP